MKRILNSIIFLFCVPAIAGQQAVVFQNFSKNRVILQLDQNQIVTIAPESVYLVNATDKKHYAYTLNNEIEFSNKVKEKITKFIPSPSQDALTVAWVGLFETDNTYIDALYFAECSCNIIALVFGFVGNDEEKAQYVSARYGPKTLLFRQPLFEGNNVISIPNSDTLRSAVLSPKQKFLNMACENVNQFLVIRNRLEKNIEVRQQCGPTNLSQGLAASGDTAVLLYNPEFSNNYEIAVPNLSKASDQKIKRSIKDLFSKIKKDTPAAVWIGLNSGHNRDIAAVKSPESHLNALVLKYTYKEVQEDEEPLTRIVPKSSYASNVVVLPTSHELLELIKTLTKQEIKKCDQALRKKWGAAYIDFMDAYIQETARDINRYKSTPMMKNVPQLGNIELHGIYWQHILSPNCKNLSGFHHDYQGYFNRISLDPNISGTKIRFSDISNAKPNLFFTSRTVSWDSQLILKSFFPDEWDREEVMNRIMNSYSMFARDYNTGKADLFRVDTGAALNAIENIPVGSYYATYKIPDNEEWSLMMVFEVYRNPDSVMVFDIKTAFPCQTHKNCTFKDQLNQ